MLNFQKPLYKSEKKVYTISNKDVDREETEPVPQRAAPGRLKGAAGKRAPAVRPGVEEASVAARTAQEHG